MLCMSAALYTLQLISWTIFTCRVIIEESVLQMVISLFFVLHSITVRQLSSAVTQSNKLKTQQQQ